jgi:hypothetical protein
MNELVLKNRRLYGAQMIDVFLNRGYIRARFLDFLKTTLVGYEH